MQKKKNFRKPKESLLNRINEREISNFSIQDLTPVNIPQDVYLRGILNSFCEENDIKVEVFHKTFDHFMNGNDIYLFPASYCVNCDELSPNEILDKVKSPSTEIKDKIYFHQPDKVVYTLHFCRSKNCEEYSVPSIPIDRQYSGLKEISLEGIYGDEDIDHSEEIQEGVMDNIFREIERDG